MGAALAASIRATLGREQLVRFARRMFVVAAAGIAVLLVAGAVLWTSGWRMFIVHTGSMTPNIPSGDLVIDRPATSVHVGDVITFDKVPGQYTTHRVAAITPNGIRTRGDANPSDDFGYVTKSQVSGRVVAAVPYAGFAAVFFRQPAGIAGVVLIMVAVWLAWSLSVGRESEPVAALRS